MEHMGECEREGRREREKRACHLIVIQNIFSAMTGVVWDELSAAPAPPLSEVLQCATTRISHQDTRHGTSAN
ncbi:hypothetical protein E2C01_019507 [Portunus trituberculatus]|uniref:Uncharacterized protein n=1 Tax=Portunus trituberculatus TaxID=210409 RepID=A0A5B7DXE3_PORTR|nr:hypothetical protein [Portunus trituberculatus]